MGRPTRARIPGATTGYGVLLPSYERISIHDEDGTYTPQQQRLYACLRTTILNGQIEEGTRLAPSRTLAKELGIVRNSVLYVYKQFVSGGSVLN